MKFKPGVDRRFLKYEMRQACIVSDNVYKAFGKKEATCTSTYDGVHSITSYHPWHYAIDLRTWYFPNKVKALVYEMLRRKLKEISHCYDIVLHSTHIHIEYDKEKEFV